MSAVWHAIVEPGFFHSSTVGTAVAIGAVVAVVCGAVGVFTVVRGHSFAAEGLGDVGSTGGSAAYLVGVSPLWGFVGLSLVGSVFMSATGARSRAGRDIDTGIVVGGALGLSALFLYLDSTHSSTTGAPITILFGSIFAVPGHTLPAVAALGGAALLVLVGMYRMLLLASLSPDLAAARGVPVRLLGIGYLVLLGLAVALSAITIGAILSTTLLIGPPAAALRVTDRPGIATALAGLIGVAATCIGILLAYDSYYWPGQSGWPASFLIVSVVLVAYAAARLAGHRRRSSSPAT